MFDWQKGERTHEFASDKFKGLVEYLGFHPQGDWLLAAGGGDKDGFLMFFDLAAKKVLAQEKAPMYVHDLALNEKGDTIYAVGHQQDRGPRHEGLIGVGTEPRKSDVGGKTMRSSRRKGDAMTRRRCTVFLLVGLVSISALTADSSER